MSESRGLLLVLCTALVSGFSIFLNSFAVQGFNPFAFTFLKNAVVALFLLSLVFLLKESRELKELNPKKWGQLAALGLVGGSAPFLLYFYALKLTSAVNAGFLHKTIFIWATILAFLFLRERVSRQFIAASALLFAGNFLFFGLGSFGFPELLALIAAMLWAAENVIAKNILRELSGRTVAFGRMFFGSAFILAFLAFTNQLPALRLSIPQIQWVMLTALLLFFYVFTYYSGLKHLPVHKATALLLLAQPITAFLSLAFLGKPVSLQQALGLSFIVFGAVLAISFAHFFSFLRKKVVLVARNSA
jgi:drug/metabolite transporter (DMT)-like permease